MREEDLKTREGVYARTVTVKPDIADANGTMTVLAVAANMQEAAGDQLIDLKIGFDVTSSLKLLWVVVWSEFTFIRLPKVGETVTFYTWPGKKVHWFYPRRAYVFDENGNELIHASYLWMLMDADTRKVTEDKGVLGVLPVVSIEGECKIPPMKIPFPEELKERSSRTVMEDEIDNNRHLNNAHSLNWIMQIAEEAGFATDQLQSLWINYKKEILPGDTVGIAYERSDSELFVSGDGDGEHHFVAKLVFSLDK